MKHIENKVDYTTKGLVEYHEATGELVDLILWYDRLDDYKQFVESLNIATNEPAEYADKLSDLSASTIVSIEKYHEFISLLIGLGYIPFDKGKEALLKTPLDKAELEGRLIECGYVSYVQDFLDQAKANGAYNHDGMSAYVKRLTGLSKAFAGLKVPK